MKANVPERPPHDPPLVLTLYVAGDNAYSRRARENLDLLVRDCAASATIHVVDVLESPAMSLDWRIFATPTLVIAGNGGHASLFVGDPRDDEDIRAILVAARESRV